MVLCLNSNAAPLQLLAKFQPVELKQTSELPVGHAIPKVSAVSGNLNSVMADQHNCSNMPGNSNCQQIPSTE